MRHLAFLHTASSNAELFETILRELSPGMQVRHKVNATLLTRALEDGQVTHALRSDLSCQLDSLKEEGAGLIVCTCSTLGDAAETAGQALGVPVLRVDRPMAEAAIDVATDILIAACVPSTIGPTGALLARIAQDRSKDVKLHSLLMDDVWPLFEAGDLIGYSAAIAGRVHEHLGNHDAVVLAQASMAGAADLCRDLPVPVFSSPLLGAREAVRRFQEVTSSVTPN